ncbi:MAG: hypothetical protein PHS47_06380 [Methanocellales archaeon]|nr:hypothetical protein [Methanocellales archaeon]MDD3421903.1 hypothetical protein [Methanocellales archaeon]MDD4898043.1 hypothetical protein [Methanocellales archaeon]MDD5447538.1 hypothetical protein [Methanocellales archaeon]
MGTYCALIGDKFNRLFEPKDQCCITYDYESREIEDVIGKAVKSAGLEPIISKHIKLGESTGLYCTTICESIKSSKICITDISEENTNVGLKIGIAWRYGKPVILTRDKTKKSDISAFTRVNYQDANELETELTRKIQDVENGVFGL